MGGPPDGWPQKRQSLTQCPERLNSRKIIIKTATVSRLSKKSEGNEILRDSSFHLSCPYFS